MAGFFDEDYYLKHKVEQLTKAGEKTADGQPYTVDTLKTAFSGMGITAESHYNAYGRNEKLNPNPYFNEAEYLTAKKALLAETDPTWAVKSIDELRTVIEQTGMTAADHYQHYGAFEANSKGELLNPSNAFDANAYFAAKLVELQVAGVSGADTLTVTQVVKIFQEAGMSPVTHYGNYGAHEAEGTKTPLVQTVPSEQRVPNDPARTENVPGNYNPPTVGAVSPEAAPAPVAKPADVGAKVSSSVSPAVTPPAKPLPVPGDDAYVPPPDGLVDTNTKPVVPPSSATNGNWAQVNPDGSADLVKPGGGSAGTVPPGSLKPNDPSNPGTDKPIQPETPGDSGGGSGGGDNPGGGGDNPGGGEISKEVFATVDADGKLIVTGAYTGADMPHINVTTENNIAIANFNQGIILPQQTGIKSVDISALILEKGVLNLGISAPIDSIVGMAGDHLNFMGVDFHFGVKYDSSGNMVTTITGGAALDDTLAFGIQKDSLPNTMYTVTDGTVTPTEAFYAAMGKGNTAGVINNIEFLSISSFDPTHTFVSLDSAKIKDAVTCFSFQGDGEILNMVKNEVAQVGSGAARVALHSSDGTAILRGLMDTEVTIAAIGSASGGVAGDGKSALNKLEIYCLLSSITIESSVVAHDINIVASGGLDGKITSTFVADSGSDEHKLTYHDAHDEFPTLYEPQYIDNLTLIPDETQNYSKLKLAVDLSLKDDVLNVQVAKDGMLNFASASVINGGSGDDILNLTGTLATNADLKFENDDALLSIETINLSELQASTYTATLDLSNQTEGFRIISSKFADTITGSTGNDVFLMTQAVRVGSDTVVPLTIKNFSAGDKIGLATAADNTGGLTFATGSSISYNSITYSITNGVLTASDSSAITAAIAEAVMAKVDGGNASGKVVAYKDADSIHLYISDGKVWNETTSTDYDIVLTDMSGIADMTVADGYITGITTA